MTRSIDSDVRTGTGLAIEALPRFVTRPLALRGAVLSLAPFWTALLAVLALPRRGGPDSSTVEDEPDCVLDARPDPVEPPWR